MKLTKIVNYNFQDGTMYKEGDEGYTSFDAYDEAIFKKNPLLIYTPKNNSKIKGKVISYPMGMIEQYGVSILACVGIEVSV